MLDVTRWKETEESLGVLTRAVEQTADHVMITDHSGVIEYVNPAFEQFTGYHRELAIGQTARIVNSGHHSRSFFASLWNTILQGRVFRATFRNRKRNGELYFEEKTIAPIRDRRGAITHFVSTGRDITERARTREQREQLQAAVERSALEWRLTFDSVESAILLLDSEGCIRRVNRAVRDLAGMPYEVLVGRNVADVGVGEPWRKIEVLARLIRKTRRPTSCQVHDPATGRTWDMGVSLASDPEMAEERIAVVVRDITTVVELQESVRRSETMAAMGALVAGVAHEVRNPLFGILATLDALEHRLGSSGDLATYLAVLREQSGRLTHLMQDLMEYGRPIELDLRPDSMTGVLQEAVTACEAMAREARVSLRFHPARVVAGVRMDRQRLQQVFQNLIENAIHYAPVESFVHIRVKEVGDDQNRWIECVVEDEGTGFVEDELERIFDPFYSRRRGGTGLGLSIVQSIVDRHGGRIVAGNREEGGARIVVRLPEATESRKWRSSRV